MGRCDKGNCIGSEQCKDGECNRNPGDLVGTCGCANKPGYTLDTSKPIRNVCIKGCSVTATNPCGANGQCLGGICKCRPGFVLNPLDSNDCIAGDCIISRDQCENGQCVVADDASDPAGRCQCNTGFILDSDNESKTKCIKGGCNANTPCKGFNARCVDGKCQCNTGAKDGGSVIHPFKSDTCLAGACTGPSQCTNGVCDGATTALTTADIRNNIAGRCVCNSGFFPSLTKSNECVERSVSNSIPQCTDDAQCNQAGKRRCDTAATPNRCVECTANTHCTSAAKSRCILATSECGPCTSDNDCSGINSATLCKTDATDFFKNKCVQCMETAQCTSATASRCDLADNTCKACGEADADREVDSEFCEHIDGDLPDCLMGVCVAAAET